MSSKSCSRQKNSAYQDRNESFALLLQSKKVNWKKVYGEILKKSAEDGSKPESAHFADSMYHQAIAKACLDPEVCPQTLQLLLNRSSSSLATIDKIKLSMKATRCNNDIACHALLQTDNSMLSWKNTRGDTLLHLVCAENGWNCAIAFLLDATLDLERHDQHGCGLFNLNIKDQCPLWLSLEGGADIVVILNHMRRRHFFYLKNHADLLSKIVAEYCTDVAALEDLVQDYPTFFDGNTEAPLHYACYYQNPNMIRFLLQHYLRRDSKRKKLLKRLMTNPNTVQKKSSNGTTNKAPLTYLVQGVGRSDPANSMECIGVCQNMLGSIPVLHYALEEALWPIDDPSPSLTTSQCLQAVRRIIDHWQIALQSLDDKKRTILSLLIMKQPMSIGDAIVEETLRVIIEHILMRCPKLAFVRDKRRRLPLHLACEAGWVWINKKAEDDNKAPVTPSINDRNHEEVLGQIVQANPLALEEIDPKVKLYPFAIATDTTTIYNLLRYQPGVLAAYR